MSTTATHSPPRDREGRLPIFAMALAVLAVAVAAAFAVGWLLGRILL